MRQQAIEKLGNLIVKEWRTNPPTDLASISRMNALSAKWEILINRDDNRAASVIREIMNGELDG